MLKSSLTDSKTMMRSFFLLFFAVFVFVLSPQVRAVTRTASQEALENTRKNVRDCNTTKDKNVLQRCALEAYNTQVNEERAKQRAEAAEEQAKKVKKARTLEILAAGVNAAVALQPMISQLTQRMNEAVKERKSNARASESIE